MRDNWMDDTSVIIYECQTCGWSDWKRSFSGLEKSNLDSLKKEHALDDRCPDHDRKAVQWVKDFYGDQNWTMAEELEDN